MKTNKKSTITTLVGYCSVAIFSLLFVACSDSPSKAIDELGDMAKRRHQIAFKELFTAQSVESLVRQWREDGVSEGAGWMELMQGYLGDTGELPEVVSEEITAEDRAVVKVRKETKDGRVIEQDLIVVKEKDKWKLDLGEMSYQVTAAAGDDQGQAKPAVTLDDGAGGDDWDIDGTKERKVEDFDLSGF